MKITSLLAAALAVAAAVAAPAFAEDAKADNADAAASDVLTLTKDNFKTLVNPEKLMLVEFYAPWCGHCKALAPEYEKAATQLKPEGIKLGKVDCTENLEVCNEFQVQGYPTMKVFREGAASDYAGGRNEETITRYMRKQAMPSLSAVTPADLESFKAKDRFVLVAYLPTDAADSADRKTVQSLADKHRNDYTVGYVTGSAGAKALGVSEGKPALVAFRTFDEPKAVFKGDKFDADALAAWAKVESVPTMDDVTPENYMRYVEADVPLAFFFYESQEDRKTVGAQVEKVAREFKGKVNFVYTDAAKFGVHAETLALKVGQWPAFAINEIKKGLKWPFDQTKELTESSVREFVQKYVKGEMEPFLKTEEVPEKQEGPVFKVVGKQFSEAVLDEKKDVFLEVYAPWCGHCRKIAPIWEDLARSLSSQSDKVVIAAMDGTENDIPPSAGVEVEGFPTIKLFRAGDNKVIDYNGDRSFEDMAKFLVENSKNKITAPVKPEPKKEEGEDKGDEEKKAEDEEKKEDAHSEL